MEGVERHDLVPGSPPALADGRITVAPGPILEGRQRRRAGGGIDGPVDILQRGGDEPAVLIGDEIEAVAQEMNDASLDGRLGEDGEDRFREALQAVDDGEQHVLDAAVAQFVHDPGCVKTRESATILSVGRGGSDGSFRGGADRSQMTFLPECLDDWVGEDNPVHVIEAFVEALDLPALGFEGAIAKATGRPSYHPAVLLKLYIYGYLNRVQSSRRLEREAGRNVELMWLLGRLVPDHKTIADFRKENGAAIRKVCARFVALCRSMGLLQGASVAVDGSKFKAVNNRDKNFTQAKMARRMAQIEESIARYLHQLDSADRQEPSEADPDQDRAAEGEDRAVEAGDGPACGA